MQRFTIQNTKSLVELRVVYADDWKQALEKHESGKSEFLYSLPPRHVSTTITQSGLTETTKQQPVLPLFLRFLVWVSRGKLKLSS